MKKFLTLSLVALFALTASAAKPQVQKAHRNLDASISTKTYTEAKLCDAKKAPHQKFEMKGTRVIRPHAYSGYSDAIGAAYEMTQNGFYCGVTNYGSGFAYNRSYMPPFSDLTFKNQSLGEFPWVYQDPITGEDGLTSSDTDLTIKTLGYDFIDGPYLSMGTDTAYIISPYLQIAGEVYTKNVKNAPNGIGIFGASNYNIDWDGFYYSTNYYSPHCATAESSMTEEFKELGIDTVHIVGYAEYMNKPSSPYMLYDVYVPMLAAQAGTLTLHIYKVVTDEEGYISLGDMICESETEIEQNAGAITYAQFSDLQGIDPETGLEGELLIDEPIMVVVEAPMLNYPLFFYHDENLPNERHAFNLISFEYNGEEYTDIVDVNYGFYPEEGAPFYMSSFAFGYNLAFYYLHNNESSDTFNVPAEGGSKTFNVSSYQFYEGNDDTWWDITDPDLGKLPNWITVEIEDEFSEPDSTNTIYYQGNSNVKITVAALPDSVESRTQDVMLSYDGAKCIFHIVQPEGAGPAYNEFYMFGDFNGWVDGNNPLAMTATENEGIYEATTVIGKNGEFKFATPWDDAPEANKGYRWFGGVDENNLQFFLVNAEQLNKPLTLVDNGGSNFRMEKPGKYIFRLNANNLTVEIIPVEVPGDVNGDGVCNAADVTALYNWILNNDDSALVNGNQNGDDVINAGDVTTVYNIILGN